MYQEIRWLVMKSQIILTFPQLMTAENNRPTVWQYSLVQFSLLHFGTVIFAFPLSEAVDGTERTVSYCPVIFSSFILGS